MSESAARAISRTLLRWNVKEMFGNPGTTELPFLEGINEQKYYLVLHDSISVGAADGMAQAGRSPAVASLHAAPGLGNAMGFVYSASRNRSPVVLLVGQQDTRHIQYDPLLFGDMERMVAGLVKYSREIKSSAEAEETINTAMRHAVTPPEGPVLLSLPMDLMETPATGKSEKQEEGSYVIPPADIKGLADTIEKSGKVAIIAGYEVDRYDAFDELAALADKLGSPVFAEPLASRAPVPANLPQYAGDLLPASALIASALVDYDLTLLLGADLTIYPYFPVALPHGNQVLYIGSDPAVPGRLAAPAAFGNVKNILRELLPLLKKRPGGFRAPKDLGRASRAARAAASMGGYFVLEAAMRHFKDFTVVDEAVSLTPTLKSLDAYRGKNSYFGYRSGQLGWGLAASIGISMRVPHVLTVLGDGSLEYSVQSLWTISHYKLPVKVLILNNHSYAILRSYSKAYHTTLVDKEYFQLPGIDIPSIAKGYGMPVETVASPDKLEATLKELKDSPGPMLLNVEIDKTVPDLFS